MPLPEAWSRPGQGGILHSPAQRSRSLMLLDRGATERSDQSHADRGPAPVVCRPHTGVRSPGSEGCRVLSNRSRMRMEESLVQA